KQGRLPAIDPLNEAPHPIPPPKAAESYSANQITKRVFTQARSLADIKSRQADVRFTPKSGHCLVQLGCPLCARSGSRRNQISGIDSSARREGCHR
ncbi:MAG: hypothetical protein WAV38_40270, partial [Xanthobacteraceae bacterium]